MDYEAKMAAMKNMMDFADEEENNELKSKAKPKETEPDGEIGEFRQEKSEGSGGGMGGVMSLFNKFMGK